MSEQDFLLEEITDRLMNVIRVGQIFAVDQEKMLVRVRSGGLETGWLRVFSERAGKIKKRSPLDTGETVVILSPMGDTAQGIVLRGLNTKENPPANTDPDKESHIFSDGLKVTYDRNKEEIFFECRSCKISCDDFSVNCKTASVTNEKAELITTLADALQEFADSKTDTMKGPNPLIPGSVQVPLKVEKLKSFLRGE